MSRHSYTKENKIVTEHQEMKKQNHIESDTSDTSDGESDNDLNIDNRKCNILNIQEVIALLERFIKLINESDLTTSYDTHKTNAALELIKLSTTYNMTEDVTRAMLDGAYWLIMGIDTDKYTLARAIDNAKFKKVRVEKNLQDSILTSLDT